jgi:L-aminopeptidase/D-esterase-like protein
MGYATVAATAMTGVWIILSRQAVVAGDKVMSGTRGRRGSDGSDGGGMVKNER